MLCRIDETAVESIDCNEATKLINGTECDMLVSEEEIIQKEVRDQFICKTDSDRSKIECVANNVVLSNNTRRILKYLLSAPLLLVLIFGGLFLLYDDWFDWLDHYGLRIAPQLHHVRGAPPI